MPGRRHCMLGRAGEEGESNRDETEKKVDIAGKTRDSRFARSPEQQRPQRMVLVAFPHPGMKVPAFLTGTCRDVQTQKVILCVYVPTTPVPTSGYFLLVPEEEAIELNWTAEESLQAIISAGLTAPPQVSYFRSTPAAESNPAERGMGQDSPVPGAIS